MEVSRIRALRGPNLWSRHTAIEAVVTCTADEQGLNPQHPTEQHLRRIFPQVGPFDDVRPGQAVTLAHALEKVTLGLQIQAGCPVSFSRTTPTEEPGVYQVVVEYSEETVGRKALELAEKLCHAAISGMGFDLEASIALLHELDEDVRLGPSTAAIVDAALARGIPVRRLTDGSMVQFGWGAKQRRIQAAEVDTTSAIAESIAQDKALTKSLLHAAGVPVPLGKPTSSLAHAWQIANEIGLPVVVKPQDGNQGKGVSVNISDRHAFDKAYATALRYGMVMVEKFLPGHDYDFWS